MTQEPKANPARPRVEGPAAHHRAQDGCFGCIALSFATLLSTSIGYVVGVVIGLAQEGHKSHISGGEGALSFLIYGPIGAVIGATICIVGGLAIMYRQQGEDN
jgi:hypothetical protein